MAEPVDGAGLALPEHAAAIARTLALSEEQTALLVAELRNALVPAVVAPERAGPAVRRVLALADALAVQARGG